MPLSHRENYIRNARFQGPEWIPANVSISGASRVQLREDLEDVMARHPWMYPGFEKGKIDYDNFQFGNAYRAGEKFVDNWGCTWESSIDGIEGVVMGHPLSDWSALDTWQPPDPLKVGDRGPVDWDRIRADVAKAKAAGALTSGGVPHGFLFMRLTYLRGFENALLDMATGEPRMRTLVDMIVDHNMQIVRQYVDMGVDLMEFGEDLGTQTSSIISPRTFREWITPGYEKLIAPCAEKDMLVALHSDGYIMDLMDEFRFAGVNIINPQDLCNGIDNLAREVKGQFCIRLDIDRQTVVPFGTRAEIRELIEEEVRKLGSPQGGLEFICGIYPPTPAENVDAVLEAIKEFRTYWWDGRGG
ncbi:MAG: hypothetical protein KBI47_10570 [Armatimonadetes bacterium]|nr:hypothetical protein [Armatimonadota bacterium]MDI9583973.1 uroporphyrinogen decarboxylase family protein [Acidobacteriota bacterium]